MALPLKLAWELAQDRWAALINPFLSRSTNQISLIESNLLIGTNVINHKLGRQMQGWFLTDSNALAQVYRSKPFNDLTLTLVSSANATVTIGVF